MVFSSALYGADEFFVAKYVEICYTTLVMEKRTNYYVSRKNALTWLMALCMVCSAVARILFVDLKGVDTWSQIVLPIAAALLYALIVLLDGKEHFYRSAVPVWMNCAYYGFAFWAHDFGSYDALIGWLFIIVLLFLAVIYTQVTEGKRGITWILIPIHLIPLACLAYITRASLLAGDYWYLLADALVTLGLVITVFAIRIHTDGEYHPTWGDRSDGRKIRTLAPMAQITAFFQVEHNTCSNLFEESFEITHIERYIRQKRKEGYSDFGLNHVLLAAYVRGVAKYPQLNRFISGQKVYSRGNDIQYSMVVKKDMTIESPDTSFKVHLSPYDTSIDIYNKMNAAVEDVKKSMELDSSLDSVIQYLNMIPSVILKFVVWLLKLLDYFGLLPKFLLELSPFHGSLFFTSMGSLGIKPIYHHLYDFGNLPVFGAFGCKRKALELQEDGTVLQRKYIDMKFVLDERIVDGYYYAVFFKYYRSLLRHPEVLDNPPEIVNRDID